MTKTHKAAPTAAADFFQQRRVEFDLAAANRPLAVMRKGQTLYLQYRNGRPSWSLDDGKSVSVEVTAILVNHALVVPTDDSFFPGHPGQTWRYAK
jgi:hypothetical protein